MQRHGRVVGVLLASGEGPHVGRHPTVLSLFGLAVRCGSGPAYPCLTNVYSTLTILSIFNSPSFPHHHHHPPLHSNKGKAKKKEDPVVDDPNLAVAAMAVAAAVEDKQHHPTKEQSVEDAAAEAGLAVVTETADDHHMPPPLPSPPMGPPLPEESPYPYPINAGKDVISGKGGKVRRVSY